MSAVWLSVPLSEDFALEIGIGFWLEHFSHCFCKQNRLFLTEIGAIKEPWESKIFIPESKECKFMTS